MDVLIAMVVKMKEQFRPHIATGTCVYVCVCCGVHVQYIMAVCVCVRVCVYGSDSGERR